MKQDLSSKSIMVKRRRPLDALAYVLIYLFTGAVFLMALSFFFYILREGLGGISLAFLTTAPNPIMQTIGIFPSLINTLYVVVVALIIVIPIGVGGSIYINEYAKNRRLIRAIEFTTETLSGIPSILFGVFGYMFFCLFLDLKVSLLAGALTLAIIVLPTIIRTSGEALKAVPNSYREGATGIGATKWYMIRTILLPSASGGLITAVILAVGRMVGESAALLLVAGGSAMYMPKGTLFEQLMGSGATLSVELYRYAYSQGETETGFSIAAVLLLIVIVLNIAIKLISKRLNRSIK